MYCTQYINHLEMPRKSCMQRAVCASIYKQRNHKCQLWHIHCCSSHAHMQVARPIIFLDQLALPVECTCIRFCASWSVLKHQEGILMYSWQDGVRLHLPQLCPIRDSQSSMICLIVLHGSALVRRSVDITTFTIQYTVHTSFQGLYMYSYMLN